MKTYTSNYCISCSIPYELRPAPSLKIQLVWRQALRANPQLGNGPLTVAKATWIQLWNDWNILRFLVIPYPGICSADYLLPEFYDNKLLCFDTNESFFEIIFCDIQLLQQNKNKGGKGVTFITLLLIAEWLHIQFYWDISLNRDASSRITQKQNQTRRVWRS